jgi:hypothetical protein
MIAEFDLVCCVVYLYILRIDLRVVGNKQAANQKEDSMESFNGGVHAGHSSDDRLLQGEYKVDVFGFVKQGWELFRQEPGKYIGFFLLLIAVYLIEQIFGKLFDFGSVTNEASPNIYPEMLVKLFLMMALSILFSLAVIPLYVGFNIVAFKQMSGQKTEFGNFFHGYRYWTSLIASALVQGVIVFIIFFVVVIVAVFIREFARNTFLHDIATLFVLLMLLLFLVSLIYITVIYIFSQMLIIDRRLGFWQAMEMSRKVVKKQWFSVFGLLLIIGLLSMLGVLALFVGLLVTVPVSQLTLAVAYKEIFGLQSSDW